MGTYIVFDEKSGEIIHTHTEVDFSGESANVTKNEVLEIAKSRSMPRYSEAVLDVLDVDRELGLKGMTGRIQYVVDPETRSLIQKKNG
jgi:hypothetical protein